MKLEEYPPQEPLSEAGQAYGAECWRRSAGIACREEAYGADPYQRLAVYEPKQPDGRVLLFWHGGGWTSGYKEWMGFMAPAAQRGGRHVRVRRLPACARASLSHRASTIAADSAGWVAGTRRRARRRPRRVFIGGHSAGGHYAALLAASAREMAGRARPARRRRPRLPDGLGRVSLRAGFGLTMRPHILGPAGQGDRTTAASPLLCVDPAACAPFLLSWGSRDFPHLIVQGRQMLEALRRAGVAAEAFVFEGADHFEASLACGQAESGWPDRASAWMETHRTPTPDEEAP